MTLSDIGYNDTIQKIVTENNPNGFSVGRVISEQKEHYSVLTINGEYEAEITGNMRFSAQSRLDFPAVGDWVFLKEYDNNFAIIYLVLPRYSILKRRAIDKHGEIQIIATNIDYAIIIVAADRDFNLNRIERYLSICNDAKIKSIIVISKIDLLSENEKLDFVKNISTRIVNFQIIYVSNKTLSGFDLLNKQIVKGLTYCLLGSSGVGKSSLLNNLSGKEVMKTGAISNTTNKGKHVTSYRELVILDNGGILIDNPGMREVGVTDSEVGISQTFIKIVEIAQYCKFSDCTHIHESGCAVLDAIKYGEIEQEIYDNFIRLKKEKDFFESTKLEKHKKEKTFGKIIKNYKKGKKPNKFY